MNDYKKLYHTLFRATEEAINSLIAAQKECEEIYIASEQNLKIIKSFPVNPKENKTKETKPQN